MNPKDILTKDEIKKCRTPEELSLWVDEKINLFMATQETEKYFRERRGLAKNSVKR
jgi:hypothetical protein